MIIYNTRRQRFSKNYLLYAIGLIGTLALICSGEQNNPSSQKELPRMVIASTTTTSTDTIDVPTKKFKSIQIQKHDTLWNIAEANISGNYTVKGLVEEIKFTNHLKTDKIIAGNYLIIPYYE